MAENDKKPHRKQTHVSDGVGELSKQNFNKGTPSTSQKLGVTPRGRRLNLKQLSTLTKEEKRRDKSADTAKSPKKPRSKRGSLKMNKSNNQRVSPYATRSLSPFGFLRNGKRKNNINMLDLKRKYIRKRVIADDVNTTVVEDSKARVKLRKSPSPELRPTKIRNRQVSEEASVPPITKCSIKSESVESGISLEIVKDEVATDDKVSDEDITLDSLSGGTQVSQDTEEVLNSIDSSMEEECSIHASDVSLDKSSFFTMLSDSKDEHCKIGVTSCKDDLISKKDTSNSCDMVFDLSKCGECLKPVIDGTKVQDDVEEMVDASEDSFSEGLYLSESPRSFVKEDERLENLSKSHFEADRCTLDTSSGILSAENSQSSVIKCNSSEGNFLSSTNLPQSETDESRSGNTTHNSVSLPNSEESMNQLIDNIRSVKMHVTCDSNDTDATDALEMHVQNDACNDDVIEGSQEVGVPSDDVVAEEKEKMESAKDSDGISVVNTLEAKENCNYNSNSFNHSESLIENGNKSVFVVGDPVEINCNHNSTRSIESDHCHIADQDSSKSSTVEENLKLQQKIRSSLTEIVKKGLLTLPQPETDTNSNEEPMKEESDDKLIMFTDSDSSITSLDRSDENEEIFRDGAISPEKSCHDVHENECEVNENIEKPSEETEIIECQVNESPVALITAYEEKVTEFTESPSVSVTEPFPADSMDVVQMADEENCNQKESEDATNSSEAENIVKESSTNAAVSIVEDSEEQLAIKETILNALGLQSSRAASLNKSTVRQGLPPIPSRTSGTLKTIIKVPRMVDKRRARNRLKLVLKNDKPEKEMGGHFQDKNFVAGGDKACHSRQSESMSLSQQTAQDPLAYRIFNDNSMSIVETWGTHMSKQKSKSQTDLSRLHYSRSSINGLNTSSSMDCQSKLSQDSDQNIHSDGSSNSARSSQQGTSEGTGEPSLVIPEKSSSFSIHPERLCHDVCCYCFGKFGSLDTPMHLAQMKGEDKRRSALALEAHLSLDSCLCDACYRYLDRKASCPSYQPYRRQGGMSGGILTKPQVCCVRGCSLPAHHLVRRKWLTRLKRSISKLLPLELNPLPAHHQQPLHAPLCSRHFYCLEYYSMCGICKRKLSRNNMHPVGREVHALNSVLLDDSIPVTLTGKIFLCKMCRYYSGIRLKFRDKKMLSTGHKTFFDSYRRRIWHYLGIQTLDSSEISVPMEIPKKRKKSKSAEADPSKNVEPGKQQKKAEGVLSQPPETISDSSSETGVCKSNSSTMPTKIRFKLGNVSIEQLDNIDLNKKDPKGQVSETVTQSGSQRKSESTKPKKKSTADSAVKNSGFPGVEQLGLNASFVFHGNSDEKNKEWEKCTTTIQFDTKTKKLWQNLYYPYGNFSSFIRHLVIMERNWRNGDLVLAPNASTQAVNYVNSVQNRIAAYEGSSSWQSTKTLSKPSSTIPSSSKLTPSKPVSVPQNPTKEIPQMMPLTAIPRINLTSAQIQQCSTPITAQLIPVNPTANFLPISCAPNQFISLGSPGSFFQIGGPVGLVHQLNSTFPCVQLEQEVRPEKDLTVKADEISGPELPVVSGQSSSSSSTFDLHISNVRSLAEDGNSSCWEQQPERQLSANEELIASSTYDSDKTEEAQMQDIAIIPVAPLAVVSTPQTMEISDNHTYSDKAVGSQSTEKSLETQDDLFKKV